jgi:hypothetical protein
MAAGPIRGSSNSQSPRFDEKRGKRTRFSITMSRAKNTTAVVRYRVKICIGITLDMYTINEESL